MNGFIENSKGVIMRELINIYKYKEMLYNLVRRDLRSRYKASFMGFLWTFINPLMQLAIYSIVFPYLMRISIPNYTMFLFVVLLPWTAFSSSVQIGTGCIVANSNMIKKIYFPRMILPLSVVLTNIVNYLYCMVIVLLALLITGIGIHVSIAWFPIVLLVQGIFSFGMVLITSAINVFFRDIEHIVGIVIMAWFYATPILYTMDIIPEKLLLLYKLNPMVGVIEAYRNILFYGKNPDFILLGYDFVIAGIMVILGVWVFQKSSVRFAEEL